MRGECDRSWEIDAFRDGKLGPKDAESFERHRRGCVTCGERIACDERLRELARSLAEDPPSELVLRRLRSRVLRDVATGAAPEKAFHAPRLALAGMLLATGIGGWMAATHRGAPPRAAAVEVAGAPEPTPVPEPRAGAVVASSGSRWTQKREGQLERVRLDDGTITAHVRPQLVGERFLVELPDGELEVRGTTFEVTVDAARTKRVHVEEGVVELRLHGEATSILWAGQTWPAPAPVTRVPAPTGLPQAHATERLTPPAPPEADDGSLAFSQAMEQLRRGSNEEAARAFHSFAVAHPGASQSEDGSFLEAVALARAGRADAAALAAEHHLESFPRSFHRREASVLVARAASRRGECDKARAVLASWPAKDADVRTALGACSAVSGD